jgi:hypothetical protein
VISLHGLATIDGLGRPRMVSIPEAARIRRERISESRIRAGETRKRRSEAAAAAGAAEGSVGAQWSTGHDIIFDIICYIKPYVYMLSYAEIMKALSQLFTMQRGVDDVLVLV